MGYPIDTNGNSVNATEKDSGWNYGTFMLNELPNEQFEKVLDEFEKKIADSTYTKAYDKRISENTILLYLWSQNLQDDISQLLSLEHD